MKFIIYRRDGSISLIDNLFDAGGYMLGGGEREEVFYDIDVDKKFPVSLYDRKKTKYGWRFTLKNKLRNLIQNRWRIKNDK